MPRGKPIKRMLIVGSCQTWRIFRVYSDGSIETQWQDDPYDTCEKAMDFVDSLKGEVTVAFGVTLTDALNALEETSLAA